MSQTSMPQITIAKPDDWHLHLRDGEMLKAVLPHSTRWAGRAIIMPNLVPPVVTAADAAAYRDRILDALPGQDNFTPLMMLYLTEQTEPNDVVAAAQAGIITGVKLYPAGATTNSASGVRDMDKVMPVLSAMAEAGIPLMVHGEVVDQEIDIFDREAVFIERVLHPLREKLPELRITFEHITTSQAVEYVRASEANLGATITPHHLVINRNAILAGGIKPHYYCLPVAKRETHRQALLEAALSGDRRFFLGTDSAPHTEPNKLQACGCAGIFNAPNTIEILAQIFDDAGKLSLLEGFVSRHGPNWYGLPVSDETIILEKQPQAVTFESEIMTGEGPVAVFDPMLDIFWKILS